MKYIKSVLIGMILLNASITAQFNIPSSVTGSGGSPMSGSSNAVNGTVGQTFTGILSGNYSLSSGFWYTTSAVLTDIQENDEDIPFEYELLQNYPNPFNPSTVISWQLAVGSKVTLKIYDVLGREIVTLVNEFQNAGIHHSTFSPLHYSLPSGVYFYQLTAGEFQSTKKMILTK
ncbi:MAG: T9SS type A sorting domain-containing protein [bacterium]